MLTVQPSATFEVVAQFTTGLTGTLGVRLIDNAGATTTARVTAGIAEYPAGSGVYEKTMTAPATGGQYTVVWDDTAAYATEDLLVTSSAASIGAAANLYATQAEVKNTLSATGTTFLDDDIDDALSAASRAIDEACGRVFYTVNETRVYTAGVYPYRYGGTSTVCTLDIDDLNSLTSLKVDTDGDGTFETTWTSGTDFYLDPPNAALRDQPYERVVLRAQAGRVFPGWDNAVQIIGAFGWSAVPPEVAQYCKLFATQLLLRSRQAPFGVLMAGMEAGSSVRISRFDPDFDRMLGHLVKPHRLIA